MIGHTFRGFRRALAGTLVLVVAMGCRDVQGPGSEPADGPRTPETPQTPLPALIVSNPVRRGAAADAAASLSGSGVVYASLPPGSVPNGQLIVIRTRATGAETTAVLVDGGFDPVPVTATVGDTLDVEVFVAGESQAIKYISVAPERRPPVLVRSVPPPGRRDVPLNVVLLLVFSEPIDGATLTASSVRLSLGGAPVAGSLEFGDDAQVTVTFTTADPLAAGTEYTLLVTQEIADVDGDALEAPVTVDFVTAAATGGPAELEGRLAVVSDRDGDREIYAINADGSGLQRLTTHSGLDEAPAWSPDGSRIAFASDRDGVASIYVMEADGSNISRRTDGLLCGTLPRCSTLAWSPGGSAIAFETLHHGSAAIATVDNTDDRITFLFNYPGYDAHPSWSPDGRELAFVSDYVAYDFVYDIYTMNADGTRPQRLTEGFGGGFGLRDYLHPAWSPDGSMIAFVYGSRFQTSAGTGPDAYAMRFKVAVMSANGVFIKGLAWAGDIPWIEVLDPGSLTWSPDGRSIAYTFVDCDLVLRTGCSGARSVNYVSIDGSQGGVIVANADSPSWRR